MSCVSDNVDTAGATKTSDGQRQQAAAPTSDKESTVAPSSDCASLRSSEECRGVRKLAIVWEDVHLGHRIQPYLAHASCTSDVYLLGCLLKLTRQKDIDGASVKLVLRALRFLHRCDYSTEDICSILAHASAYFLDAHALCGRNMAPTEVGNVLVTLMFIAHSYVQDETCPLDIWHRHLFKNYCSLKTLSAAVVRLLEIRRYILRLGDQDLTDRYTVLTQAAWKPHE